MERFKFRVWNKIETMFFPKVIEFCENGSIDFDDVWIEKGCFEIMQCLGIKDKADKLVYEGDVVKLITRGKEVHVGEVEFAEGTMGYRVSSKGYWLPIYGLSNIEILGNIYENPELLTKQN